MLADDIGENRTQWTEGAGAAARVDARPPLVAARLEAAPYRNWQDTRFSLLD